MASEDHRPARYVSDLESCGAMLRPPDRLAHAELGAIDTGAARALPGVVAVFTAADLPTRERTISSRHSAVLARQRSYFCGQPVALVLAESEAAARDAADLVRVDYTRSPRWSTCGRLRPRTPR